MIADNAVFEALSKLLPRYRPREHCVLMDKVETREESNCNLLSRLHFEVDGCLKTRGMVAKLATSFENDGLLSTVTVHGPDGSKGSFRGETSLELLETFDRGASLAFFAEALSKTAFPGAGSLQRALEATHGSPVSFHYVSNCRPKLILVWDMFPWSVAVCFVICCVSVLTCSLMFCMRIFMFHDDKTVRDAVWDDNSGPPPR